MIGVDTFDADLIVVHPQDRALDGESVVVRVCEEEATTKRMYRDGRTVRLVSENDNYEPIIVNADDVELVGRVVGVLRQL